MRVTNPKEISVLQNPVYFFFSYTLLRRLYESSITVSIALFSPVESSFRAKYLPNSPEPLETAQRPNSSNRTGCSLALFMNHVLQLKQKGSEISAGPQHNIGSKLYRSGTRLHKDPCAVGFTCQRIYSPCRKNYF